MFRRLTCCLICVLLFIARSVSQSVSSPTDYDTTTSQCANLDGQRVPCPQYEVRSHAEQKPSVSLRPVFGEVLRDQKAFWTAPSRLREKDLGWALPFIVVTGGLIVADPDIDTHFANHPSLTKRSQSFSSFGLATVAASTGGMYLWGRFAKDDDLSRTGLLGGEALADSFLATLVIKSAVQRARPLSAPTGTRGFGAGGNSFPSEHAAAAWAVGSVVAHRYPGPATKLVAYGAAAAISAAQVSGRQHFASDVFIGGALGWYIGRQVAERPDHNEAFGTFERSAENSRRPEDMPSPSVPLDSWIYPAFDRLSALGIVKTAFADLRPWTRMECARLLEEAGEMNDDTVFTGEAERFYTSLTREFALELEQRKSGSSPGVQLESLYTRIGGISGTPLRDGYHFGQTIGNDYGRPYGEGINAVTGLSADATAGPLTFYVRGEYQRAPSAPYVPAGAAAEVSAADHDSPPYPTTFSSASRFGLLDAYVSLTHAGYQLSFGRQSLSWGPGANGGLLFSNNIEPITMFRVSRSSPGKLPGLLGLLGPVRTEFFVGQVSGQLFVHTESGTVGNFASPVDPQPFIHGEKISFMPTPNFEFSVGRTTIFGGPEFPFNADRFFRSMFSTGNSFGPRDPGDRRSSFSFQYRVPGVRDWLVLYTDSFTEDEISPLAYPRNAAFNPGIYLPRVPGVPKLDFRAEAAYTPFDHFPGFFYSNVRYLEGYTSNGQLIGSWIGRQARALQFWTTYWTSPRTNLQASYRGVRADHDFLEGGRIDDISVRADVALSPVLTFTGLAQYERWNFPLLSATARRNITASVELVYNPTWKTK